MAFVIFEKGQFLGFFDDPVKAGELTAGRIEHGPHQIVEYVPVNHERDVELKKLLLRAALVLEDNAESLKDSSTTQEGDFDRADDARAYEGEMSIVMQLREEAKALA